MNKKGFAGILFVLAVFIVMIMLLGANNTSLNYPSSKESITESKLAITNYQLNLIQMTNDCNWQKSSAVIGQCIETDSLNLLTQLNSTLQSTICIKTTLQQLAGKKFLTDINCTTTINDNTTYTKINASKIFYLG